jgi:hypothetical protein
MSGIGLPSVLLALQLGVGLVAAGDLARSLLRRRVGLFTVGQVLTAVILTALGVDGLFLGLDVVGQVVYALDFPPEWARLATIALILASAFLWSRDR